MTLSIIIVNYNVRRFLENALTSIRKGAEGLDAELFVVDNASNDGSIEMVKEKFPEVRLIANTSNLGFARANNQALELVRGRYILLINPDTVLQEDTLPVMLRFMEEHPDAGLAGCKILNPDGSFQLSCRRSFPTPWVSFTRVFGLSSLFPGSKLFGRYNLTYLDPDGTYPVDAVSGSFMFLSRRAYERVGGLDEEFFMYGEDLDYCFRIQKAGFRVYYVHGTQIVHFKGESTQRSSIDEIAVFYQAMRIFVRKHFGHSFTLSGLLSVGITLRAAAAFLARAARPLPFIAMDFLLVAASMVAGEYLRYGRLLTLPSYAYPMAWIVPPILVVASLWGAGVYATHRYSVSRSFSAVVASFIVLAAIVFFARDYAFSRIVVAIAGVISLLIVPGWRLLFRLGGRTSGEGRKSLFGRRTVIVGTGPTALTILRKLRARVSDGYEVVGFVSTDPRQVGDDFGGVPVIGGTENVGKVLAEWRVTEVIFSGDGLSYKDILSVIARSSNRGVNFRLVPNSLEAIIGKASIDELDPMPLVEIEYHIHRLSNRVTKRVFDILLSFGLLVTAYPVKKLAGLFAGKNTTPDVSWVLQLPRVLNGDLSFVGVPLSDMAEADPDAWPASLNGQASSLGPYGITGLVQIQSESGKLEPDEIERLKLYYARNQSLALDLEILLKSFRNRKTTA